MVMIVAIRGDPFNIFGTVSTRSSLHPAGVKMDRCLCRLKTTNLDRKPISERC